MKIFTGKVISKKMKDTATVSVSSTFMHKLYGKRFRKTKKYHVHDEYGTNVGDTVCFIASRPFSKIKKWKILDLKTGKGNMDLKKQGTERNDEKITSSAVRGKSDKKNK